MRLKRDISVIVLSICLSLLAIPAVFVHTAAAQTTQDTMFAVQRGYRTGYSDGYMAGYRDTIDSLAKSYSRHTDYTKANRAFNKDYGTIEDYKDGYQQGFESGYNTGFERRSFDANLPQNLSRRGGVLVGESTNVADNTNNNTTQNSGTVDPVTVQQTNNSQTDTSATNTYPTYGNATIVIPRDTELILELQEDLSTERSRAGDKFTAKIVAPAEIAGATVEGRIAKITQPGRIKRRSEMSLSFDRVILADGRWTNFSATMIEVMPVKGDNVKRVDNEGTAIGQSSLKSDLVKVGGTTTAGLVIGAVAGGPVGAAVGAGVGAAFGVGAVVIERGKHIKLNRNQQMRIKTSYESQIR